MTTSELRGDSVLSREAVIHVRQSSPQQALGNLESQRRQYELVTAARSRGLRNVDVIDDDQGLTASGQLDRLGFERLCAKLRLPDLVHVIGSYSCTRRGRIGPIFGAVRRPFVGWSPGRLCWSG